MKTVGLLGITALCVALSLPMGHHHKPHHPKPVCTQVAPGWCLGGPPIITPGI